LENARGREERREERGVEPSRVAHIKLIKVDAIRAGVVYCAYEGHDEHVARWLKVAAYCVLTNPRGRALPPSRFPCVSFLVALRYRRHQSMRVQLSREA